MKTSNSFKTIAFVALLGAALSAPVLAQGGRGMGMGMGGMGGGCGGAQMQYCGPGNGAAYGMGGGRGGGRGMGMMSNANMTRGWTLMTPAERTDFQIKMRAVKTYDECTATQGEHRSVLEARAKDKGVALMTPRGNACDMLKARGLIM